LYSTKLYLKKRLKKRESATGKRFETDFTNNRG
jgi:hypothetical protein